MAESISQALVAKNMQEGIIASLRKEYPWMVIEAVHIVAQSAVDVLCTKIKAQQEQIEASRSRCSFMSLPPELRDRIYAFALVPERHGEGGVPGSTGISIRLSIHDPVVATTRRPRISSQRSPTFLSQLRYTPWAMQPAITRVNRHIRAETLPVYYGANKFYAVADGIDRFIGSRYPRFRKERKLKAVTLTKWLAHIGPSNVALLRTLVACYDSGLSDELSSDFGCARAKLMAPFVVQGSTALVTTHVRPRGKIIAVPE